MNISTASAQPQIATAPVSFGIFGSAATAHAPRDVLAAMVAAGFTGSELGPPGLFGTPFEAAELFAEHDLTMVGAYAGLNLTSAREVYESDLAQLQRTCDELLAGEGTGYVILADEGDPLTRANPARSVEHPIRWTAEQWDLAASRITDLVAHIAEQGLTPSFHPHIGTYVENRREIETLLERTPVDLTLDTGHFMLAGVDPTAALIDYKSRVNHIHVKDVRMDGLPSVEVARTADLDDWWGAISSPLGMGDVDLHAFLTVASDLHFPWYVIEQDRDPAPNGSLGQIGSSENDNRRWLVDAIATSTHRTHASQTATPKANN